MHEQQQQQQQRQLPAGQLLHLLLDSSNQLTCMCAMRPASLTRSASSMTSCSAGECCSMVWPVSASIFWKSSTSYLQTCKILSQAALHMHRHTDTLLLTASPCHETGASSCRCLLM